MSRETEYGRAAGAEHIRALGQYFTPRAAAEFMCRWACAGARSVLDPAAGNGVFLSEAKKVNPDCRLLGYELDGQILEFFGNPSGAELIRGDYLLDRRGGSFDAIVCNPPYGRFQSVENREEIIEELFRHTGMRCSRYTNLYILFLIKSISQLRENGRLAYIIPTEFLNSKYGEQVKELLIRERLLAAIINFRNNGELFYNAVTTCCILLLEKKTRETAYFYNLSSLSELSELKIGAGGAAVRLSELKAVDKWRPIFSTEEEREYRNLAPVSKFCRVSRGIATGANSFFCLSKSKIAERGIPMSAVTECVCRSADVGTAFLTRKEFSRLAEADKSVYLLDVRDEEMPESLRKYIADGERLGINGRYLVSRRKPWYSMEHREPAPIWISSACRGGVKVVRNLTDVKALTTFHSLYVRDEYIEFTDVIFCWLLTPTAKDILRRNRKELGGGLEKFQPGDIETAEMLDVALIYESDLRRITSIYEKLLRSFDVSLMEELERIFSAYLTE